MARKQPSSSSCTICDTSNLASVCSNCVNFRLSEYHNVLKALNNRRDFLSSRLSDALAAKEKGDDQQTWRVQQNEKLAKLREKLRATKENLSQAKAKKKTMSHDLNIRYGFLESAEGMLAKHRSEKLEKYFPNWIQTQKLAHNALTRDLLRKQSAVIVSGRKKDRANVHFDAICNACLPQGLDPHSVKSVELSASLGYMVQMLNIIVRHLAVPVLHNAAFAGSCSRIWQRDSYWDARSSSQSNEYPLFIPRQNHCAESSSSSKSSSNFGVSSMESEKKSQLDLLRSSSFNFSCASSHTVETHKDVQRGIALLKKSVACITAYYHHLLCLEFTNNTSTFGAFAKLLAALAFPEGRPPAPVKMAASWSDDFDSETANSVPDRSHKQGQQLNMSVGNANSLASSIVLLENSHASLSMENLSDSSVRGLAASFLSTYIPDFVKTENTIEEWDFVEHLPLPPPPSEAEDIEHWTRAMFTDATTKR
ncbi:hypothetical protein AKJ16_DCAP23868 [Drosera capensis]